MPCDADVSEESGRSSSSYSSSTDSSTRNAAHEAAADDRVGDVDALAAAHDPHLGLVRRREQLGRGDAERVRELVQRLEPRVARVPPRSARASPSRRRSAPPARRLSARDPAAAGARSARGLRRGPSPRRGRVVEHLQGLQIRVEVERVVASLAADARDADAAERRRQVADQEGVDPDRAGAHRAADALRRARRCRCTRAPRARTRSSWRARSPRPRPRTSGTSAPGRRPRAARSPSRSSAARRASARTGGRPSSERRPPRTISSPAARARSTKPSTRARWSGWISGDIVVASSRGSPSTWASVKRWKSSRNASETAASTSSRVPARQTWPESSYCPAALRAAASRSQSAKTISGPLPPSSPVNGTRLRAAETPIARAVSGEPVNEIRRARGSETSAAPISSPMPCTTFSTPGGKPASSARSASSEQASGDHSAGLRITVQPAASAGAVFQVESMNGAFHGRDHDRRPGGHADHAVGGAVRRPDALLVALGQLGVAAVVAGAAQDHARLQRALEHRHVAALDDGEALDVALDQVGEAPQVGRAPGGDRARPRRGTPSVAASRARSASRAPPRATCASSAQSIGEWSAKRSGEGTRRPPMKWSVETSTPATRATDCVSSALIVSPPAAAGRVRFRDRRPCRRT